MIFHLSLVDRAELDGFLDWAREHLGKQRFAATFEPALAGLVHVARGGTFDAGGHAGDARRFLGWSAGKHWLFGTDLARQ